jgi:hypothetical protein
MTRNRSQQSERPRGHDPDIDPPHRRRHRWPADVPREFQRLLANPFLALVVFVAGFEFWIAIVRYSDAPLVWHTLFGIGSVVFPVCLLHYHCLDCGHTGWFFRWKKHACDTVLARQYADLSPRLRLPSPTVQAVLWTYLIIGGVLITAILQGDLH